MSDTNTITPAAFRAAEERFQRELLALLSRHRDALGGEVLALHALIDAVGRLAVATLTAAGPSEARDRARRHVHTWIAHLQTYVATAHGDVEVIGALIEMLKTQIEALQVYVASANARPQ